MSSEPTGDYDSLDRLIAAFVQSVEAGRSPDRAALLAEHPEHAAALAAFFADYDRLGPNATAFHLPNPESTVTAGGAAASLPTVRYLGDYELLAEIARGGMGVVFRARQVSLNRPVAVKMILAGTYATESAVQRFRAEAEAAANLDHPNILPIYEVGEHEGHQYFSMKLITGGSLTAKLAELRRNTRAVARLVETLARAVHYAHQRGILHRDLKPANILIDTDGTPVITDFGLAKRVGGDSDITQSGAVVGTPSYMPPEQAKGAKDISTSADVYSLGAILYELLTGCVPFKGASVAQTLRMVEEQEPASPRSLDHRIDKDLSTIALKCLEKTPDKRYASAEALADDLKRWQRGEPVTARRAGLVRRTRKWITRNPVAALVMIGSLAGVIAVSVSLSRTRAALAEARWQGYISSLMLASREVADHNHLQAGNHLEKVPAEMRGWEWRHLQRLVHPESAVWEPHLGSLMAMSASQDGRTIAVVTSSTKNVAALLSPEGGRPLVEFQSPDKEFGYARTSLISVAGNGEVIAVGNGSTALVFLRDKTLRTILNWSKDQSLTGFTLDSKGERLAAITKDHHVQVWNVADGKLLFDERHDRIISNRAVWRDGDRQLVAACHDCLRVIDLGAKTSSFTIPFTEFEQTLEKGRTLKDEMMMFPGLALSGDGRWIAMGGVGIIVLVDLQEKRAIRRLDGEDEIRGGTRLFVDFNSLEFSPDGKHVVAVSPNHRAVRVWNVKQSQPVAVQYGHTGSLQGLAFLPGGTRVVTAGSDVAARVWAVPPEDYPRPLTREPKESGAVVCLEVSRDGRWLAVGEVEGHVSVYDTHTEKRLWRVRPATRAITQMAFSPDGSRLGIAPGWAMTHAPLGDRPATENRDALVLDTATGVTCFKLAAAPGEWSLITSISFRADGQRILTASNMTDKFDDIVREWDAATGAHLADLDVGYVKLNPGSNSHYDTTSVAYDPSGRSPFAITGVFNGRPSLRSANGDLNDSLTSDITLPNSAFWIGFSRDGRFLAAHNHTSLTVWDHKWNGFEPERFVSPWRRTFALKDLPHFRQLAFNGDGLRLATADGSSITIRSTLTGDELIRVPAAGCDAVAFHPDGKKLYAGTANGVVCYEP